MTTKNNENINLATTGCSISFLLILIFFGACCLNFENKNIFPVFLAFSLFRLFSPPKKASNRNESLGHLSKKKESLLFTAPE